ncbi:MAG: PDZ domain-containing protein, partial [candidate division WOR-3 bacterium]
VVKGEAADRAGIKEGDVILEIDGRKVKDANDLRLYIGSLPPGKEIQVKVYRDKKYLTIKVKLGKMPENLARGTIPSEEEEVQTSDTLSWLGITVKERSDGVVVISSSGRAAEMGIRSGDRIVKIGDIEINSLKDFQEAKKKYEKSNKPILIVAESQGVKKFIALTPVQ